MRAHWLFIEEDGGGEHQMRTRPPSSFAYAILSFLSITSRSTQQWLMPPRWMNVRSMWEGSRVLLNARRGEE